MRSIYPRLYRRKHSFYIRIAVPRPLQPIVKKREIMYSLKTNYYYEALCSLRKESYRIDVYLQKLKRLKMEITGNKVSLSEKDVFAIQKELLQELLEMSPTYDKVSAEYYFKHLSNYKMLGDEKIKNWFIDYLEKRIDRGFFSKEDMKKIKAIVSKHKRGEKIDLQNLYEPLARVKKYQMDWEKSRIDNKALKETEKIEKIKARGFEAPKNVFGLSKYMNNEFFYKAIVMKDVFKPTKEIQLLLDSIKNDKMKERNITEISIKKKKYSIEECVELYIQSKKGRKLTSKTLQTYTPISSFFPI